MQYDQTDYAKFITYSKAEQDTILEYHRELIDIDWLSAFHKSRQAYLKKRHTVYKYMVTFTTRPDAKEGSLEFLETQAFRECLGIILFEYCVEHPDTNLHYHALIHTTKPLLKSSFKWWIQNRGTVKIDKVTPGTEGNTLSYLHKELKIKHLVP